MSTPLSFSGFSGEAAASSGMVVTGRRFANRPSALRMASRPLLGTVLDRDVGPLRAADGAEQDARRSLAGGDRRVGQRRAGRVVRRAADQRVLELELQARA